VTVYLLEWHLHCTSARFIVLVSCSDELEVHSCPLLCLQRQVAKLANGLLYFWFLLHTNDMATNLQKITSSYGSKRFSACNCNEQVMQPSVTADSGKPRSFILCEKKLE